MKIGPESPTEPEVKDQLARMLASKRFKIADTQSDFLRLVVERALRGKKSPGHVIAKELFGGKFEEQGRELTNVRAAANKLRPKIKAYYNNEGLEDLVKISLPEPPKDKRLKLPEGEAYTPEFSYNPAHPVGKEYRLGMFCLKRGMWEDYRKARAHFAGVLKMAPEHIGASIGLAEAWIGTLLWDHQTSSAVDIENMLKMVADPLRRLDKRASGFWRLHALGGVMLARQGNLEKAAVAFDTALKLDRASTEAYSPYFSYLIKIGNKPEAVRLAKRHFETHPDDMDAYITYTMVLMRAEQLLEAMQVLRDALELDRGYYAVHMFLAFAYLAAKRPGKAFDYIMQVRLLADATTFRLMFSQCHKFVEAWPPDKKKEWDELARGFNRLFPSSEPSSKA